MLALLLSTTGAAAFDICSGGNRAANKATCLVDGDTGWQNGVKWRLLNIDTPEYRPRAQCRAEHSAAQQATQRMLELMRKGYRILSSGNADRYGRVLVQVEIKGLGDAGQRLIQEGLAQPWPNNSNPWCRP